MHGATLSWCIVVVKDGTEKVKVVDWLVFHKFKGVRILIQVN